jgi:hypothetical protein
LAECFYNKDGKWYYAGIYKAFQLEDLTTKEWEALSNEVCIAFVLRDVQLLICETPQTAQIIIKDTIAGRKNTSPQNVYETSQLYAAGALRVACVGLQCVGFNNSMYRAILELASKCAQNGKWRAGASGGGTGVGLGLGSGGVYANIGADNVGDRTRIGTTNRIMDGNAENMPGEVVAKLIR